MDDKKKKIYIAIISVCFLVTAGILWYGFGGGGNSAPLPEEAVPVADLQQLDNEISESGADAGPGNLPQAGAKTEYSAPPVFPQASKFDLSLYNDSDFTSLTDYTPLTVNPEDVGRENPFNSY